MTRSDERMTPTESGRALARLAPPPSDAAIEKAARILATVKPGEGRPWMDDEGVITETKPVAGDGT